MKMKRLTASIAAFSLLCLSTLALAGGPVDRLADRLDLSEFQVSTLSALFDAHRESMQSEFGQRGERGRPDPETRARMKEARHAFQEEIIAVLDAEQAEKFLEMSENRREGRRERHRPGR